MFLLWLVTVLLKLRHLQDDRAIKTGIQAEQRRIHKRRMPRCPYAITGMHMSEDVQLWPDTDYCFPQFTISRRSRILCRTTVKNPVRRPVCHQDVRIHRNGCIGFHAVCDIALTKCTSVMNLSTRRLP
jgi:hypothetical protein